VSIAVGELPYAPAECLESILSMFCIASFEARGNFLHDCVAEERVTASLTALKVLDVVVGDFECPATEIGADFKVVEFLPKQNGCLLINVLSIGHVVEHRVDIAEHSTSICR